MNMMDKLDSVTLSSGGKSVTVTPEVFDQAAYTLHLRGEYAGLTHKEVRKEMGYSVKVRVSHGVDKARILAAMDWGMSEIRYRVPQHGSAEVVLQGMLGDVRPNNAADLWLTGAPAEFVTFTFLHAARDVNADWAAELFELLCEPELDLEVSVAPMQGRLL